MNYLFHLFDILSTLLTYLRFGPADLKMFIKLFYRYHLTTKFTFLGFILTALFVLTKSAFHCRKVAVLTLHLGMLGLLMLFPVGLGDAHATGRALVVLA